MSEHGHPAEGDSVVSGSWWSSLWTVVQREFQAESQRAARRLVRQALQSLSLGVAAGIASLVVNIVSGHGIGVPTWLGWLLGAIAALAAVVTVLLLLLAALQTQRRYRMWWTALGVLGVAAVAGLAWVFVRAEDFVPAPADPSNATEQAARITAATTLRGGALAGVVGLAAIGTLIVNAVGARTAANNLELARETQDDARAQAQQTAADAARTLELTRTGQLTDRYVAAVELLTAEAPAQMSHLGGIYALERLAADAPGEYRATIVEVLSAYVRTRAGLQGLETAGASYLQWVDEEGNSQADDPPRPEHDAALLAALTVLGRIADPPPDDPTGNDEPVANDATRRAFVQQLQAGALRADLRQTNLRDVTLDDADLRGAQLQDSDLRDASLRRADLRFADLTECDLTRARLDGAKISGTKFADSWLRQASLDAATAGPAPTLPEHTQFASADLTGCSFTGADLRGARLADTHGLKRGDLEDALGNSHTTVPPDVARPGEWPAS